MSKYSIHNFFSMRTNNEEKEKNLSRITTNKRRQKKTMFRKELVIIAFIVVKLYQNFKWISLTRFFRINFCFLFFFLEQWPLSSIDLHSRLLFTFYFIFNYIDLRSVTMIEILIILMKRFLVVELRNRS